MVLNMGQFYFSSFCSELLFLIQFSFYFMKLFLEADFSESFSLVLQTLDVFVRSI